jgi:predicted acyl esterase
MVTTLPARSTTGKRRKDVQDAAPDEGKAGWMATVRKVIRIDTDPATAWDAVRDWTALPTRLVRGFVVDTKADGEDRIVTFFNGIVARERLVALDDVERRLVWSVVDGPYTHHNGAAQVFAEPDGTTRFEWTADFLPDELADRIEPMMERGIQAAKETLEN